MVGVILCIVITSLVSVFIINTINNNEREREALRVRRIEMGEQLLYADSMFFESNGVASESLHWAAMIVAHGEVEVSDVVFVHSEAESGGFPEDAIVAWPSEDTVLFIENLNSRGAVQITLSEFDVTSPLTLEDSVENWKKIREAWMSSRYMSDARVTFLDQRRRNADSE